MGAQDNEEIIELTDVIEEGDLAQPSDPEGKDIPHKQAIDPRTLEDEFEQLLQGSQNTVPKTDVDNDLDIESLFDDLEKDTPGASPATDTDEADNQEIDLRGLSGSQNFPELDDLFSALGKPAPPSQADKTTTDEIPDPTAMSKPSPEEPSSRETDMPASPIPPLPQQVNADIPDSKIAEFEARIAALETASAEPDQESLFTALSAFFQTHQGLELIAGITSAVSKGAQETARTLVEEKLASMDVPSSEEITAMVKEEIKATVAENIPQPPDTDALITGIREELQQKVQAGMDAWEAERIALTQAIEALRKTPSPDISGIQEQSSQQTSGFLTSEDFAGLKAELDATLAREIPAAAARIIREEIAALLKS